MGQHELMYVWEDDSVGTYETEFFDLVWNPFQNLCHTGPTPRQRRSDVGDDADPSRRLRVVYTEQYRSPR